MSALGSLVVKLALNHAEYTQGLDRSSQEALKFAQNSQKSFDQAERSAKEYFSNVASGAVGVVTSIVGIDAAISRTRNAINFLANLDDAAQRTQSSVEDISRIAKTAKNFGDPFDQIEQSISKLGKGLATFDDEGNQALRALDAIGVKARDSNGQFRTSAEVYIDVAKALQNYKDGLGKTAVVNALFGKSGSEQLPLLNNLAQGIDDVAGESAAATKRADDFNNSVAKGNGIIDTLYTQMAIDLLPTLTDISGAINDSAKEMDQLSSVSVVAGGALKVLAIVARGVFDAFRDVGREIGGRAAQLVAIANGDFKGAGLIGDEITKDFIKSQAEYEKFVNTILAGQQKIEAATGVVDDRPPVNFTLNNPEEEEAKKRAKRAAEEAAKAAEQQAKSYKDLTVAIGSKVETNELELKSNHALTESEKIRLDITGKIEKGELVLNSVRKAKIESQLDELAVSEKLLANNRFVREQSDALSKSGNSMLLSLRSQVEQQKAQNALIGLSKEQVIALTGAKNMETAAVVRNAAVYAGDMHDAYIQYANDLDAAAGLQKDLLQEQQVQQYAQNWNQAWSNMEQTGKNAFTQFAAHGKSAIGSIKESLKLSLIDLLYQVTARPWIIKLGTSLEGAFINSAIGSAAGGAVSGGAGFGNILSLGSLLGRGASALGFSSFGAGASGAASAGVFGAGGLNYLGGAGTALGTGAEFGGMASLGAGLSSVAGPLAALAASVGIGSMIAGDKKMFGMSGTMTSMIGAVLGGPIGALIGGGINALFGRGPRKFRQEVAIGDVSAEGFDGRFTRVDRAKGGLLVGNKHWEYDSPDSAAFQQVFDTAIQGYAASAKDFAKNLGLSTDAVTSYSKTIRLESEKGKALTQEQISSFLRGIGNEFAQGILPTVDALKKAGEDSLATLGRLSNEFTSLSDAATILGKSVAESRAFISGASFEGRSGFVDAAGGIDALNQKAAFFAQNFLTDAERLAPSQEKLNDELKRLNLSTDLTKDQFRDLVQSFGKVNGISEDTLQSLLNLQGGFLDVRNTSQALADAQVNNAYSALQRSVETERNRITEQYNAAVEESNKRIQNVTESIGKLKTLSDALKSTVDAIRPLGRDQAKQQIIDAISAARAGGALPEADSLKNALGVLSNSQSISFSAGSFEFAREQAKTANLVAELGSVTDSQLLLDERSLAALEDSRTRLDQGFSDEMGHLDSLLSQGQAQIEALNGINTSVLSLNDALGNFNLRVLQGGGSAIGGVSASGNAGISDKQIVDYFKVYRTPEEIAKDAIANGVTSQQIVATGRFSQADADKFFLDNPQIPRFASGGYHRGGLRLVGERGPEIEATGPSRITSNNDLQKMLSNDEVVKTLLQLIGEVQTNNKYNQRVASKLDAVTVQTTGGQMALRTGT